MKPVWGSREVLLKPDRVLLWAPSSIRLQAGIFDRLVRPPAIPADRTKEPNKVAGEHVYHDSFGKLISHPLIWLLLMLQQWWTDLGQWKTFWTRHIHRSCVWTGSAPEPCRTLPQVVSVPPHSKVTWNHQNTHIRYFKVHLWDNLHLQWGLFRTLEALHCPRVIS